MFMSPEKFENAFRLIIGIPLFDRILKQDDKEISVKYVDSNCVCLFSLCVLLNVING